MSFNTGSICTWKTEVRRLCECLQKKGNMNRLDLKLRADRTEEHMKNRSGRKRRFWKRSDFRVTCLETLKKTVECMDKHRREMLKKLSLGRRKTDFILIGLRKRWKVELEEVENCKEGIYEQKWSRDLYHKRLQRNRPIGVDEDITWVGQRRVCSLSFPFLLSAPYMKRLDTTQRKCYIRCLGFSWTPRK